MSTPSKGRAGGVLPINPAATRKPAAAQKNSSRSPGPRLRLIVRRLSPGLIESEFWDGLGAEWQVGNGKVDWFAFKPGKVSRDPSKPSRPGRAYLKVKDQSLLDALAVKIKQAQFKDAKNTSADPCLVGPPSLEFAPYNKVPGGRARNDGRQGTIDQDQEFIDFLQSLTEPITKPTTNGLESSELKAEKITTTPLVQFIKEKKANKAKDKEAAAASKSSKKQESKEPKAKIESKPTVVVKSNTSAAEKARVAKATQDAVKAINKSVASMQTKATATTLPKNESKAKEAAPSQTPPPKRERERGSASAAAKMISRDLGLAPKEPRTPRAPRNTSSAVQTPSATPAVVAATSKSGPAPKPASASVNPVLVTPTVIIPGPKPSISATPPTAPPTGPRNTRTITPQQPKQPQQTPQRQTKSAPQPSSGARSAFLKHANPSQGVTEELLRTTFAIFGEITRCEIDKKKGLGYIDFTDTESLKKAMTASPVKIGNGQVTVLENRSPYRKGTSGQQRAGDSSNNNSAATAIQAPSPSVVTSAASSPQVTTATVASPAIVASVPVTGNSTTVSSKAEALASGATVTPSTQTTTLDISTPTAPRGARAGANTGRGGRGGGGGGGGGGTNFTPGRGGFTNKSARGNFRGGRGGRGARGAVTSTPATATAAVTTQGSSTAAPASTPVSAAGQGKGAS